MSAADDKALTWVKVLLPFIIALMGSEAWQYYAAPGKIKQDTSAHVDDLLVAKLERKLDSLSAELVSREYAKSALTSAVGEIKQLEGAAAKHYLTKVFSVADQAIKNDSAWRNVQLPYIKRLMNKRFLCPVEDITTGAVIMQGIGGEYPVRSGRPDEMQTNGQLTNDVSFYYDQDNQLTPLTLLRKPIYRR